MLKHDDQGNLQKMSTWIYSPQTGRVHNGRVEEGADTEAGAEAEGLRHLEP